MNKLEKETLQGIGQMAKLCLPLGGRLLGAMSSLLFSVLSKYIIFTVTFKKSILKDVALWVKIT